MVSDCIFVLFVCLSIDCDEVGCMSKKINLTLISQIESLCKRYSL